MKPNTAPFKPQYGPRDGRPRYRTRPDMVTVTEDGAILHNQLPTGLQLCIHCMVPGDPMGDFGRRNMGDPKRTVRSQPWCRFCRQKFASWLRSQVHPDQLPFSFARQLPLKFPSIRPVRLVRTQPKGETMTQLPIREMFTRRERIEWNRTERRRRDCERFAEMLWQYAEAYNRNDLEAPHKLRLALAYAFECMDAKRVRLTDIKRTARGVGLFPAFEPSNIDHHRARWNALRNGDSPRARFV